MLGLAPEVLEPDRGQLGVSEAVLYRAVAEPILDSPRVVAGVGEGIAAGVTEHGARGPERRSRGKLAKSFACLVQPTTADPTGAKIDGWSFSRLFTRVEMAHMPIWFGWLGCISPGSLPLHRRTLGLGIAHSSFNQI
jgi:hypothetical protein